MKRHIMASLQFDWHTSLVLFYLALHVTFAISWSLQFMRRIFFNLKKKTFINKYLFIKKIIFLRICLKWSAFKCLLSLCLLAGCFKSCKMLSLTPCDCAEEISERSMHHEWMLLAHLHNNEANSFACDGHVYFCLFIYFIWCNSFSDKGQCEA